MVRAHNDKSIAPVAPQAPQVRRTKRRRALRAAALAAVAVGPALWAQTAQATSYVVQWTNAASGSWGETAKWSPSGYPNNYFIPAPPLGGEPQIGNYYVTIGATAGPVYTVTLPLSVTVSDFHLASPTATLAVTN